MCLMAMESKLNGSCEKAIEPNLNSTSERRSTHHLSYTRQIGSRSLKMSLKIILSVDEDIDSSSNIENSNLVDTLNSDSDSSDILFSDLDQFRTLSHIRDLPTVYGPHYGNLNHTARS